MDIKQEYQKLVIKFILLVFYIFNIKLMKKKNKNLKNDHFHFIIALLYSEGQNIT